MGTKIIAMTTTQARIRKEALRERCLSEAIRAHQQMMPNHQHHPQIVRAAQAFEKFILTGKVK